MCRVLSEIVYIHNRGRGRFCGGCRFDCLLCEIKDECE